MQKNIGNWKFLIFVYAKFLFMKNMKIWYFDFGVTELVENSNNNFNYGFKKSNLWLFNAIHDYFLSKCQKQNNKYYEQK